MLTRFLQLTACAILSMLVLTMLWANLANDKLMTVFYFVLENSSRLFLQIVSSGDELLEMSNYVH